MYIIIIFWKKISEKHLFHESYMRNAAAASELNRGDASNQILFAGARGAAT